MKCVYKELITLLQSGTDVQLGILLDTKGSAPQVSGATALFNRETVLFGTLGGGLLELKAQKMALLASESNQNSIHSVNFKHEIDDVGGAICGGTALFLMDANPRQHLHVFSELINSLHQHQKGVLITVLNHQNHQNLLIEKFWIAQHQAIPDKLKSHFTNHQLNLDKIIAANKVCWFDNSKSLTKLSFFIEPMYPKAQLVIVGAGHIGKALSTMASLVDFDVTVLDNRPNYINAANFPKARLVVSNTLQEAFKAVRITRETYIVVATQGHTTDIEALQCCIQSDAAYIGVIGSRRKSALMGKKFIAESWASKEEWDFIQSPIGLAIHSKSVNEIAISIVAQLIQKRYENNYLGTYKKVSCVVLAAGKSTRMGTQKLLLPYENTSIIKSIVSKAINSNAYQTIVVTGSHKNELMEELQDFPIDFIENTLYERGMFSSVQKGIAMVDDTHEGMLILLGDQPMVSTAIINRLITSFQKTNKGILIPTFDNKRGHPVLISRKYQQQINTLNPAIGLRELIMTNQEDVLEIEVKSNEILLDIDTPQDYELATTISLKNER